MKKWATIALTSILALSLAACSGAKPSSAPSDTGSTGDKKEVTLKVGASPVPHAEILEFIKPKLKEQGVNLDIKVFQDYVQPNVQLFEKQIDANYFQHIPYLESFNKDHKMNLVKVTGVHIEPIGAYSKKYKNINDLPNGATIAIPNAVSEVGRVLALLDKNGLIKLKDGVGIKGTVNDIVENKKNFKFKELESAMLPRVLPDVDLALINTNYALEAKLVPTQDALIIEDKDSPYVNVLAAREDNKDSEAIQKLAKELNSPEVKKFIEDKYKGSVVPAF